MGLDRGNRGGSDCVSCLREGCARAEQGARVCKSWVEECACQGKEVTKCYMRVTAPFPTQRATLLAQNEDIVPLLLQSNAKKGRRHLPSRLCSTEPPDKWGKKKLDKNCLLPPAAFFDGTEMSLRPPRSMSSRHVHHHHCHRHQHRFGVHCDREPPTGRYDGV